MMQHVVNAGAVYSLTAINPRIDVMTRMISRLCILLFRRCV